MSDSNGEDTRTEVAELREELKGYSLRLAAIERRLERKTDPVTVAAIAQEQQRAGNLHDGPAASPVLPQISYHQRSSEPGSTAAPKTGNSGGASKEDDGLEARIGSIWLNRIGAAVFLIGVISLLMYSFQYFAPILRVLCGYIIAAVIITASRARNNAQSEKKVFFEGLNALGWSLAYFVSYGMYFSAPLKVIDSLPLELLFLTGTASWAMADAVAFRSEATAALSSSFAFGALLFCSDSVSPTFFNMAFLVIAAAVTFVSMRQSWHTALFLCSLFFFGSLFYCNFATPLTGVWPSLTIPAPNFSFNLIVVGGWLLFNAAICILKEIPKSRAWAVVGTSLLSAWSLSQMLSQALVLQAPAADPTVIKAWVFGSLGTIYLTTANLFKRRNLEQLWSLHLLIGLSLVNMCRWLKLTGTTALTADLCEIALLTGAGFLFEIPMFRHFAAFWSVVAVFSPAANWPLLACAALASALCAHLYWRVEFRHMQSPMESAFAGPWYYLIANVFVVRLIFAHVQEPWQLFTVTALACANVLLSFKMRSKTSICTAAFLTLQTFAFLSVAQPAQALLSAALGYALYLHCRDPHPLVNRAAANNWKVAYAVLSNLIIFATIVNHAPKTLISALWGLEGLVLIVLGFLLREKVFRVFALSTFAIVMIRLLLIDLASAPTVERIISFIVAGTVFVGCSYVYNWFGKRVALNGRAPSEPQTTH